MGAPFRVSELSKNFPPRISLKSGGPLGLSAQTGPSALPHCLCELSMRLTADNAQACLPSIGQKGIWSNF